MLFKNGSFEAVYLQIAAKSKSRNSATDYVYFHEAWIDLFFVEKFKAKVSFFEVLRLNAIKYFVIHRKSKNVEECRRFTDLD